MTNMLKVAVTIHAQEVQKPHMHRVQAQALCSFFSIIDMNLNWLANEEDFEDSLHCAGLSLHDKWIWSSLHRQPSTSEELGWGSQGGQTH